MRGGQKKSLIIDGYNVLRSGSRYQCIEPPDYTDDAFNRARDALINDIARFAGREYDACVVFDGMKNDFSTGEVTKIGGVRIVFSPAGQSADKVIERMARESREQGIETLVVTSDATIQDTVFGGGVERMSANGFSREMDRYDEEVRLDAKPQPAQKRTVADRIDGATLAKLKALRDLR